MYGCESWTMKKAEHRRFDAFKLRCWRRLLRSLKTAWRPNQSILKEVSPEYSLKGLMLKLKLQYFGHLRQKTDSLKRSCCWERLKAEREGDERKCMRPQEAEPVSVQFSSVTQSCPTLCNPINSSTPGLPVHHQLPEFTQTHVHRVSDAIQPSHPLLSPSPHAPTPSQHQSLFQ